MPVLYSKCLYVAWTVLGILLILCLIILSCLNILANNFTAKAIMAVVTASLDVLVM